MKNLLALLAAALLVFAAVGWYLFLVVPATAVNFVLWFGLLERYSAPP